MTKKVVKRSLDYARDDKMTKTHNPAKIKRLLAERGIKIKELSQKIGICEPNLVCILKGESFTTTYLDKFCSYFKMQPGELFSFFEDEEFSDDERLFNSAAKKDFSKLKTYFSGRGITIYRLAKDTGLTTAELYSIAANKRNPKWDTIRRVLEYLECGLGEICDFI